MARPRIEFQGELTADELRRKNALERNRRWYARNADRQRARAREWQLSNPERYRENWHRWYEENRELLAIKDRERYVRDPVGELARAQKYRASLAAAPGAGFTGAQWLLRLEEFGGMCAYCLAAKATTMDHVEPISRGGAHDEQNIVPACSPCNASKGNRSLLQFAMRGGGIV